MSCMDGIYFKGMITFNHQVRIHDLDIVLKQYTREIKPVCNNV